MKYDKLVRDNIPEIIEKKGKKVSFRILNDEEFKVYLEKKLDEEVAEFHESKSTEELADILEVFFTLCETYSTVDDVQEVYETKYSARGRFDKRICLLEVEEKCNYEANEICTNADCPLCTDYCPVVNTPEICKYADMSENTAPKREGERE